MASLRGGIADEAIQDRRHVAVAGLLRSARNDDAAMSARLTAVYRVRSDARSIDARAQAIAVEQSVEMPLAAIDDRSILSDIVGHVDGIEDRGDGVFDVRIGLATATIGDDAGQLLNMLFGNTSLHDDVMLHDIEIPAELARCFGGPRHGIDGLRRRVEARGRALTCSALKPQGSSVATLAGLCETFALAGLDVIKDDHGIADQAYAPFAQRVPACQAAVARAQAQTGRTVFYAPNRMGTPRAIAERAMRVIGVVGCQPTIGGFLLLLDRSK